MARPDFDQEFAKQLVGKRILIGLTYNDHKGSFVERRQLHGEVVRADLRGISILLGGGNETYELPPDTTNFEEAKPGEYRLKSTGEIVVDPDFITSWIVTLPEPKE